MRRKRALCGAVALALALSLFAAPSLQAADRASNHDPAGLWASIQHWLQEWVLDPLGWSTDQPADSKIQSQPQKSSCDPTVDPTCVSWPGPVMTTDEGAVSEPNGG